MAKRSDFAQKLLDDLRLRKERMASSHTHASNQSHHLPIDAYAYTKQTFRGSKNTKANEIVSSRTGNMWNRSGKSHRSINSEQVSNQIVPYGKGPKSGHKSDMSLALAFYFENGGKLRKTDSIMSFLNRIKSGTMEFSISERGSNLDKQLASSSHNHTFSHVQINEISRGAHKLNQILRACSSNALNMDAYSIQFAKELLRGAIDLEESLRMLVDLQKGSSEFIIAPQKKNRITLLEDQEDNDDDNATGMEISEKMQLARPTFSFDKASRHTQNIQQVGKAFFKQRPVTFTNTMESRNSNNEERSVKIQVSQKRLTTISTSHIKNANAISEPKNHTVSVQPNQEKGRIPNVVAKLMGLDNLPEKVELEYKNTVQMDSSVTRNIEEYRRMSAKGSTKKTELRNRQTENVIPMKNQKVKEEFQRPTTQHEELMFGVDKNILFQKTSSQMVAQNGKPLWKDVDGIKALKGYDKASVKIRQHNKSSAQKQLIGEIQKDVQANGRKLAYPNSSDREQKGTVKGRTNDLVLKNMLAQMEQVHKRSEGKALVQKEKEINGSIIQLERRHTNKLIMNNEKKSRNHLEVQKSYIFSKNGPREEKHHRELREEQMLMMRVRQQGGSETISKNSSKTAPQFINPQKKQLSVDQVKLFKRNSGENVTAIRSEGHYDDYDLGIDKASNDKKEKEKGSVNRKLGQIPSPRDQEFERAKGRNGAKTLVDEKHIYKLASQKIKNSKKQKVDMFGTRKTDQVLNGRNRGEFVTEERKQRISNSHEADQERVGISRGTGADATITSSNEPLVLAMTAAPLDVGHQSPKQDELPPKLSSSCGRELENQQESVALVPFPNDSVPSVATNMQDGVVPVTTNEQSKTGIQEDKMCIKHSQVQDQTNTEISIQQQPLTESENCLKWILVMSQLFVDTAEALFRLKIPFSIVQVGDQCNQNEGNKLILDCGYEVMKRKGIRQELKVHCCSKIPMDTMNIISLDDLVRQLNKDMENLKFYGRKRDSQFSVEDYLSKMLEHDVYDKDPDINCMWDFGWNDETFAFIEKYDIIRDTEKYILRVLLDEITRDFFMLEH